jgi:hypothetical protein
VLASKNLPKENTAPAELKVEIDAVRKKLETARSEAAAELRLQLLADSRNRAETATREAEAVHKRVENLKNDLGELSNAALKLNNMLDEQKGLRDQLRTIKTQIEEFMAQQPTPAPAK